MDITATEPRTAVSTDFPRGLAIFGWICTVGTALIAIRLVYEQTILTWQNGWQMVGFSLAHLHPELLVLGFICAAGAHLFIFILLISTVARRLRGVGQFTLPVTLVATAVIATGVLYVPYSAWMTLLVQVGGSGTNGNSYLSFATAEHHPRLVRSLLDRGVPVDAAYAGHTALNGACVVKDIQIARYLISRGADIKRAPDCDSLTELTGKPRRPNVPETSITVTP